MGKRFADRTDAGEALALRLTQYADKPDTLVLALPRGGVPVAYEVARALHLPLDVMIVRKIGVPDQPELAMGAIASGGVTVTNPRMIESLGIDPDTFRQAAAAEKKELERREKLYRGARPPLNLRRQTVILVDDGLATGASMRSAVQAVRQHQPAKVIVAVPVGAPSTCEALQESADRVVCVHRPEPLYAIGLFYEDFSQVTDEEVQALLESARSLQSHKEEPIA